MNRNEALAILKTSLRKAKRWGELCEVDERSMQEIIAALSSCACEGREVLAVKQGWATKSSLEGMIPGWWPEANDEWDDPAEFPVTVIYMERALPAEETA